MESKVKDILLLLEQNDGIFDTEQFEIIESRITDITIFRKMVEKLNDFGFENEKYKENNPNFDINIVKLMCNNKV